MHPRPLTASSQDHFLAYPHCNCFTDDGQSIVVRQRKDDHCCLWRINLSDGREELLARFPGGMQTNFELATGGNRLVCVVDNTIWLLDLLRAGPPRCLYGGDTTPAAGQLYGAPSITRDGRRALIGIERDGRREALLIDVDTRQTQVLFGHTWWANHFHFSPYDDGWIGFCHEGATETIPDRVWGWHAVHAPAGRLLFDQQSDEPGTLLCVGHERWCWHDASVLVVAYGASPAGPRGLYELYADDRPPRLVSQADRDLHCSPSQDGRWAVVDTSGPHDAPGKGWENATVNGRRVGDILLIDMASGQRCCLARNAFWGRGEAHPHPIFSPNGAEIFYNACDLANNLNQVMRVSNPWYVP